MIRISRHSAWAFIGGMVLTGGLGAAGLSHAASVDAARQQADIAALIQELDYLIDQTERLADRYRADRAPVTFNYAALLEQLRVTRARSADYLNERHRVVHAAPPAPAGASLTRRR
ncbi:MAG TPA: hypothetical protein PLJ20_01250 [Candidatus Contendobacter sp.]|jgi:ABC-type transporter Mla subunit MlaD|nr:hypothetical protein [Candidatus Contendobacter sp.]